MADEDLQAEIEKLRRENEGMNPSACGAHSRTH